MKDKWSINSKTQKIIKNKRKVRIDLRICEKNLIFVDYTTRAAKKCISKA